MYSPYGSYSSLSSAAQPLDIPSTSYLMRASSCDDSCAFPSWPRRSSLIEADHEVRATSYLSDDDLLFEEAIEDDAHSISSASSHSADSPFTTEDQIFELQREKLAMQREALKLLLVTEKERRRQATKRHRGGSSSSKKSPKLKPTAMAPIVETVE